MTTQPNEAMLAQLQTHCSAPLDEAIASFYHFCLTTSAGTQTPHHRRDRLLAVLVPPAVLPCPLACYLSTAFLPLQAEQWGTVLTDEERAAADVHDTRSREHATAQHPSRQPQHTSMMTDGHSCVLTVEEQSAPPSVATAFDLFNAAQVTSTTDISGWAAHTSAAPSIACKRWAETLDPRCVLMHDTVRLETAVDAAVAALCGADLVAEPLQVVSVPALPHHAPLQVPDHFCGKEVARIVPVRDLGSVALLCPAAAAVSSRVLHKPSVRASTSCHRDPHSGALNGDDVDRVAASVHGDRAAQSTGERLNKDRLMLSGPMNGIGSQGEKEDVVGNEGAEKRCQADKDELAAVRADVAGLSPFLASMMGEFSAAPTAARSIHMPPSEGGAGDDEDVSAAVESGDHVDAHPGRAWLLEPCTKQLAEATDHNLAVVRPTWAYCRSVLNGATITVGCMRGDSWPLVAFLALATSPAGTMTEAMLDACVVQASNRTDGAAQVIMLLLESNKHLPLSRAAAVRCEHVLAQQSTIDTEQRRSAGTTEPLSALFVVRHALTNLRQRLAAFHL